MTDPYNNPETDPQESQLNFDYIGADEEETKNIGSIFLDFKDFCISRGYHLMPSPVGKYAYNHVYRLVRPSSPEIKYPANFRILRRINTETEIIGFGQLVLDYLKDYTKEAEEYKILYPLTTGGNKSKLGQYVTLQIEASKQSKQLNPRPDEFRISPLPVLSKSKSLRELLDYAPVSHVPLEDWFPETLNDLKIEDILTIFPPHERELLSLIIGRGLVGKSNHTPPGYEEPIKHTSRMMALIVGYDPGMGKSAIFNYILDAARSTGYKIETFNNLDSQFNLGEIVTSDFIYKDDTTFKPLKAFLGSENAKTVISSSGYLRVEDKGENAFNVEPRGTIIMNCNEFNPNLAYSLDPGMKDRVHLISTYRRAEITSIQNDTQGLSAGSPNILPEYHIPWLAEKIGVSTRTLMTKFLRLCADKFLTNIENKDGVNQLEEKVRYHSAFLRMQIAFNDLSCLISLLVMVMAFTEINRNETTKKIIPIEKLELETLPWKECTNYLYNFYTQIQLQPVFNMLLQDYEECSNQDKSVHPYRALINIDPLSLKEVLIHKYPHENSKDRLAVAVDCYRKIRNRQGQVFTDKIIYWIEAWNKLKFQASDITKRLTIKYHECTIEDVRGVLKNPPSFDIGCAYTKPNPKLDTGEKVKNYLELLAATLGI